MTDISKLTPTKDLVDLATELQSGWNVRTTDRVQNQRVATALTNLQSYVEESLGLFQKSAKALNEQQAELLKLRDETARKTERVAELEEELLGVRVTLDDRQARLTRAQKLMRELLNTVQENPSRSEVIEEIRLKLEAYK